MSEAPAYDIWRLGHFQVAPPRPFCGPFQLRAVKRNDAEKPSISKVWHIKSLAQQNVLTAKVTSKLVASKR
jgi:hypothetical protein